MRYCSQNGFQYYDEQIKDSEEIKAICLQEIEDAEKKMEEDNKERKKKMRAYIQYWIMVASIAFFLLSYVRRWAVAEYFDALANSSEIRDIVMTYFFIGLFFIYMIDTFIVCDKVIAKLGAFVVILFCPIAFVLILFIEPFNPPKSKRETSGRYLTEIEKNRNEIDNIEKMTSVWGNVKGEAMRSNSEIKHMYENAVRENDIQKIKEIAAMGYETAKEYMYAQKQIAIAEFLKKREKNNYGITNTLKGFINNELTKYVEKDKEEITNCECDKDKKNKEIEELENRKKDLETEIEKYAKFRIGADYIASYVVGLGFLAIFVGYLVTEGFGGVIPYNASFLNWILKTTNINTGDTSVVVALLLLTGVLGNLVFALVIWPFVMIFKKIIFSKKGKRAKERVEKNEKEINEINGEILRIDGEIGIINVNIGSYETEIKATDELITKVKKILPTVNRFETALKLLDNLSVDNADIDKIYSLMKMSVEKIKGDCPKELSVVSDIMEKFFETFKQSLESVEDGDSLAVIGTSLMSEDYEFALKLMQKSLDKGSEGGRMGIQLVLDKCENLIYDSQYETALTFLTPLKEYGNAEAKELWRKAKDFKKQEEIAENNRRATAEREASTISDDYWRTSKKVTDVRQYVDSLDLKWFSGNGLSTIRNDKNLTPEQKEEALRYYKIYYD